MLGAIIGDVVGSRFEFNNIKTKKFKLFDKACRFDVVEILDKEVTLIKDAF